MGYAKVQELLPEREIVDLREAKCPSCGSALKSIPGAKRKCPACGEYMYVRTDPIRRARRVVSEIEAKRIDLEWRVRLELRHAVPVDVKTVDKVESELSHEQRERIDRVAAVREALNRLSKGLAERKQWRRFRNVQAHLADVDLWVGDYNSALLHLLDVRYLDYNGPVDVAESTGESVSDDNQLDDNQLNLTVLYLDYNGPVDVAESTGESVSDDDQQAWVPFSDSDLPLTLSDIPFIVDSDLPFGPDRLFDDQLIMQIADLLGAATGDILLEYTPRALELQKSLDLPVSWPQASLMLASRLGIRP